MVGHFLHLTVPVTLMILGLGGFLLYDAVSFSSPSQLAELIAAALLLALGSLAVFLQLRLAIRRIEDWRAENN